LRPGRELNGSTRDQSSTGSAYRLAANGFPASYPYTANVRPLLALLSWFVLVAPASGFTALHASDGQTPPPPQSQPATPAAPASPTPATTAVPPSQPATVPAAQNPIAPGDPTAPVSGPVATPVLPPFDEWLDGVRIEAIKRGISAETVSRALTGIEPVPQILERDRTQAEFALTMSQYFERRLTYDILKSAKESAERHRSLLEDVEKKYGVQSRFLVAVWGLESNFGRFAGVRPMIPTLATLAYEPRRATFFRQQLFDALVVVDKGFIELPNLKGSWAGAMGQPQFMPSSYLAYAQDFDGDGRRDIWTSQADVFASIAFYLKSRSWNTDHTWGRRVIVPDKSRDVLKELAPLRTTGCRAERQLTTPMTLTAWKQQGVTRADRSPLPAGDANASLLETDDGKAYLVYDNYEALLAYNCAHTYALSVSMLSDAIDGIEPLPTASSKAPKRTSKKAVAKQKGKSKSRSVASKGKITKPKKSR
jgi:membrane-bound lytic murein transglycosylase B